VAVALLALALVGATRRPRRRVLRAQALATVAVMLLFGVEAAPHLVHHALDADQGASCVVLAAAAHQDGVASEAPSAGPDLVFTAAHDASAPPPRSAPRPAIQSRAPPL